MDVIVANLQLKVNSFSAQQEAQRVAYESQLATMQQQASAAVAVAQGAAQAAVAAAAGRSSSLRLPPPPQYDGSPSALDDWIASMRQQFAFHKSDT